MRKTLVSSLLGIAALAAGVVLFSAGVAPNLSGAADHLDAPFVKTDGRIDINDVYVFQSPSNAANTVLVMTVNPAAGVLSPTALRPDAEYEFAIDNDGDAEEDIVYSLDPSRVNRQGTQKIVLDRVNTGDGDDDEHEDDDDDGHRVAKGRTGSPLAVKGGGTLLVDLFDDPFFFDLVAFNAGAAFCPGGTGTNFFSGFNTSAIVLEVPSSKLTDDSSNIGVWGRTILDDEQVERMGRPAISTVFNPPNPFEPSPPDPALEDAFNFAEPEDDQEDFRSEVVDTLTLLFSLNDASGDNSADDAAAIQGLADFLLPDVNTFDTTSSAGFPNGRRLADDVIDVELGLITEGLITTDCVANDSVFSATFPYLAPAN